jgi:AAA15 family ATPase/GTPase
VLLRFRVANHRSIRDEAELTLVAAADSVDSSDSIARDSGIAQDGGGHVPVLPVAGIFGANASGKSNLLSAFHAMREAVRTSFADWAKYPGVPHRQPFKLDAACAEETT